MSVIEKLTVDMRTKTGIEFKLSDFNKKLLPLLVLEAISTGEGEPLSGLEIKRRTEDLALYFFNGVDDDEFAFHNTELYRLLRSLNGEGLIEKNKEKGNKNSYELSFDGIDALCEWKIELEVLSNNISHFIEERGY